MILAISLLFFTFLLFDRLSFVFVSLPLHQQSRASYNSNAHPLLHIFFLAALSSFCFFASPLHTKKKNKYKKEKNTEAVRLKEVNVSTQNHACAACLFVFVCITSICTPPVFLQHIRHITPTTKYKSIKQKKKKSNKKHPQKKK